MNNNRSPNGSDTIDSEKTITLPNGVIVNVAEVTEFLRKDREDPVKTYTFSQRRALMKFRDKMSRGEEFTDSQMTFFSVLVARGINVSIIDDHEGLARRILDDHRGYLSPINRKQCEAIANGQRRFYAYPSATMERATEIQKAGIPPIFCEEFEQNNVDNPFPVVDFLVQFVSGTYRKNQIRQLCKAQQQVGRGRSGVRILQSSAEDILSFRTLAFDGDSLSPQVVREINTFVDSHFKMPDDKKKSLQNLDLLILKYLGTVLSDLDPGEREYLDYEEGANLDFVKKELWHLQYTPEDRIKIANDYKSRMEAGEKGLANRSIFKKMQILFPDLFSNEDLLEMARIEERLVQCRNKGDYHSMPQIVLVDPRFGTKYTDEVREHLERVIEEILASEDPFRLLDSIQFISGVLKIPQTCMAISEFRDIFTRARLQVILNMSDDDFRTKVPQFTAISLGHRQKMVYNSVDVELRDAILTRAKTLEILT